jgi:hypothetical protein
MGETGLSVKEKLIAGDDNDLALWVARRPRKGWQERIWLCG